MIKFILNKHKYNDMMEHLEGLANRKQTNQIVNAVTKMGVVIAKEKYAGTNVEVGRTTPKNNEAKVYARGEGLFYTEYGTGLIGQGTYPDESKLPKNTLRFESPKGVPQSTQGWQYYYPNVDTKDNGGWWYGEGYKQFTQGQKAGAQMFHTAHELRKKVPAIVKSKIKEGDKFDVSVS